MREHGADVGVERVREQCSEARARRPADVDRDEGDDGRFDSGERRELRPACARPRQSRTCVVGVAPSPRGGEDGEREQEHGDVAADQQQALTRDTCLLVDRGERVERSGDAEHRVDRREPDGRDVDAVRE